MLPLIGEVAAPERSSDHDMVRPGIGARWPGRWVHDARRPAETPGAAFRLIVPLAFLAIAFRLFAYGLAYVGVATGDEAGIEREEAAERARILAQEQSLHVDSLPPPKDGGKS